MKTKNIESKLLRRTEMHKHELEENRDKKEHSPYTPTYFGVGLVIVVCFMLLFVGSIGVVSAKGELKVSDDGYYFEYDGEPIALFGLGDFWVFGDPNLDYQDMIGSYARDGSNFIRTSLITVPLRYPELDKKTIIYPWKRSDVSGANDGGNKFDLTQFNPDFFDRAKSIAKTAEDNDVVILAILFDEINIEKSPDRWDRNPFHPDNNINSLGLPQNMGSDGDPRLDKFYDLDNSKLMQIQESYIKEVLDELKPYGNIIYGISNEYTGPSDWHRWANGIIHSYGKLSAELKWHENSFSWVDFQGIKPGSDDYKDLWNDRPGIGWTNVPYWDRDMDEARKVWYTAFMYGGSSADDSHSGNNQPDYYKSSTMLAARKQVKYFRDFVEKLPYNEMKPGFAVRPGIVDRGYARVKLGEEYVVYLPNGGAVTVDLSDVSSTLGVEWYNPRSGTYTDGGTVTGGGSKKFTPPFSSDAVLYMLASEEAPTGTIAGTVKDTSNDPIQEATVTANYYVATWGSDSNPGTKDRPWQHPSYAAQRAVAGDTIYLMDGTWYNEHVVFANSGTASSPITMTAYSGNPTLDGVDKKGTGIHTGGESYIIIDGLTVQKYSNNIRVTGTHNRVSDCESRDSKMDTIHTYSSSYITIENNKFHDAGHNTVQINGKLSAGGEPIHHISILNNHIYDFPEHNGIDIFGEMHDIDIIGNEIHNEMNGRKWSGLFMHYYDWKNMQQFTINNNNIHNCTWGIYLNHAFDFEISNNIIHNNKWYGIYGSTPSENVVGCGNAFYGNGNDATIHMVDGPRLTAEDFTDPCDEDVGTISGTVGDVLPPTIIAYLPTGTEIPVETTITVTFSEAMHQNSAESAFYISPHVSGSFSWNENKMIFTPSSDLDYITTCTVAISTVAEDLTGNNLESPFSWSFTTIEEDITPPVMSDVNVMSATSSSATITWTTDESADSLVKYGTSSGSYTESESDSSYVTSHSIALTGLTANTIYYYVVNSTDQAGNSNQSNVEYNFKTAANEYIWLEAEDADTITPDFEIASDTSASNGEYIRIPEGVGYRARDGDATYTIHIDSPDDYAVWSRKIAATDGNNSFFVQIDDGTEYLWTIPLSDNWQWDAVNHWGSGEEFNPEIAPVIFSLSAGEHILKIKQREDGAKLDRLLITNDMGYVPIDVGDTTPPTTTYVIIPTPNEAGWNNVIPVVVTFFRNDNGGSCVSYTHYSKTSETGPWTTVNIATAMGPDAENVTDIGEDKFNVTVSDEGVTTIWYYTVNNNATSEPIKNVTVKIDTTPPASIPDLQNTTGTTWINWTWTNPTDADFSHTMVYLNGVFKTNTSNPYYNATGLIANTSYEIGTHTVDTYGNVNNTWVNQTAKTVNNLIPRYDVNEDGRVDILDTTIVGQHFGEIMR